MKNLEILPFVLDKRDHKNDLGFFSEVRIARAERTLARTILREQADFTRSFEKPPFGKIQPVDSDTSSARDGWVTIEVPDYEGEDDYRSARLVVPHSGSGQLSAAEKHVMTFRYATGLGTLYNDIRLDSGYEQSLLDDTALSEKRELNITEIANTAIEIAKIFKSIPSFTR